MSRLTPVRTASPTLRKLFAIMAEEGISQNNLAVRINSTQYNVWMWRSGNAEPGIMKAEAIADALGYRIELVPNNK